MRVQFCAGIQTAEKMISSAPASAYVRFQCNLFLAIVVRYEQQKLRLGWRRPLIRSEPQSYEPVVGTSSRLRIGRAAKLCGAGGGGQPGPFRTGCTGGVPACLVRG